LYSDKPFRKVWSFKPVESDEAELESEEDSKKKHEKWEQIRFKIDVTKDSLLYDRFVVAGGHFELSDETDIWSVENCKNLVAENPHLASKIPVDLRTPELYKELVSANVWVYYRVPEEFETDELYEVVKNINPAIKTGEERRASYDMEKPIRDAYFGQVANKRWKRRQARLAQAKVADDEDVPPSLNAVAVN
jgi:hypothetical protein